MLFSTAQMSQAHSLDKVKLDLICANQEIKREAATKLLGVIFTDHLNWNEHIKYLTSSCCAVLAVLHKLKHMAPYNLHKQLVEMLVISKLDYCDTVYSPIHDYQLRDNSASKMHALVLLKALTLKLLTSLILVGSLLRRDATGTC
jgi:hypothetical protein